MVNVRISCSQLLVCAVILACIGSSHTLHWKLEHVRSNEVDILTQSQPLLQSNVGPPQIDPDILEDSLLPTTSLIEKRGYTTEIHTVVTPDGYILELHRIVASPFRPASGNKVVFLMHGLLESSSTFIMSGEQHGLGYALSDNGYDVWMGNARGNSYSRRHLLYDPEGSVADRDRFWSFTWHEIGVYDLPTMIDHVLHTTGQSQLFYIGHSQGTTSFFVMCSELPQYNAKIKMMHALAPVAFMRNAASPLFKILELTIPSINLEQFVPLLGLYEFLPSLDLFKVLGQNVCQGSSVFNKLCENVLFLIVGFNEKNLNSTLLPVFMGHTPAGISTYQILHYLQVGQTDRFTTFNWGSPQRNFEKYGSETPREYNLNNVRVPIVLHYSDNDWLASSVDVIRLYNVLPYAVLDHISDREFEHMDYVWGIKTRQMLYYPIIRSMELAMMK